MSTYLLWLDLETTGLVAKPCAIVEAAWALTPLSVDPSKRLNVRSAVVYADPAWTFWEDRALEMHTASGLKALCEDPKTSTGIDSVVGNICEDVAQLVGPDDTLHLAGSSIHFDMSFVREWMPLLATTLHYRLFDVSAQKLFMESMGATFREQKDKPHRAAQDLHQSYMLYLLCRRMRHQPGILTPPDGP